MTKKWSVSRGQDKKLGGKGMGNNSFVRPNPKQGGEYDTDIKGWAVWGARSCLIYRLP